MSHVFHERRDKRDLIIINAIIWQPNVPPDYVLVRLDILISKNFSIVEGSEIF